MLLTIAEVALLLRVSPDAVLRRIHAGRLRALRDGAAGFRVHPNDLIAYLTSIIYQPATPLAVVRRFESRDLATARHLREIARRNP